MTERIVIEKLVPGGDGLGHLADGRVAFVPETAPGDELTPLAVEGHKGYARVTRFEIVRPSPLRVRPPCPVADRCGGCDWMHIEPKAQLEAKRGLLSDALARIAGLRATPITMRASASHRRYRHRLRVHVDEQGRLGLFAKRSHDLVEIEDCLVARKELVGALGMVRSIGARHPGALQTFSAIELRYAPVAPSVVLRCFPRGRRASLSVARDFVAELRDHFPVSLAGTADSIVQSYPLPRGIELGVPARTFSQVNWEVNQALVEHVLGLALARGAQTFCDLYSGSGNFALPLMAAGLTGAAVERDSRAVRAARDAARAAGLDEQALICGDVAGTMNRWVLVGRAFDLVIADPPRSGMGSGAALLADLSRRWILLCACDPATLARDVGRLVSLGFDLQEVVGFDMFPHTHHLEATALLQRR